MRKFTCNVTHFTMPPRHNLKLEPRWCPQATQGVLHLLCEAGTTVTLLIFVHPKSGKDVLKCDLSPMQSYEHATRSFERSHTHRKSQKCNKKIEVKKHGNAK